MTPLLTLLTLSAAHAAEQALDGFRRHEPGDDESPAACVTHCTPGPDRRTQVRLATSHGTVAMHASATVVSQGATSLTVYGEAGFLPTFKDWTTMAGAGATLTVGGSASHLTATAAVYTERVGVWGQEPARTVETHLALSGHLVTQPDVTWEVYAQVDPLGSWEKGSLDGSVGVQRTRAPWEGTWHDVRFAVGLELRDSSETQAWVDQRWDDPVDLPDVLPYPTLQLTWAF